MKTVIFSDLHSDHRNFIEFAQKLGVVSDTLDKVPDTYIIQVGDYIHGGSRTRYSDSKMLSLSYLFDEIVIGNHDLPFAFPESGFEVFGGMRSPDQTVVQGLKRLYNRGVLKASTHCQGWLITHAGLHDDFDYRGTAEYVSRCLNEDFESRTKSQSPVPVFDAIGSSRGGFGRLGSIFWQDWHDFTLGPKAGPNQIMGHTPREGGYEHFTWSVGAKPFEAYCVDAGAGLSGKLSALVGYGDGVWYPEIFVGGRARDE